MYKLLWIYRKFNHVFKKELNSLDIILTRYKIIVFLDEEAKILDNC